MGNILMYIPGSSSESRLLLKELNAMAARYGYTATSGATKGQGAFSRLAIAIADRRVLLIRVVPGLATGLKAFLAAYPDEDWAKELLEQLS